MEKETSSEISQSALTGEIVRDRAEEAYDLMCSGMTLQEIAERLSYNRPDDVVRAINERFKTEAAFYKTEERHSLLMLQNARLSKLLQSHWPSATMGDPVSTRAALDIIKEISKTNRLYENDTQSDTAQVLVVGGLEKDYIDKIKAVLASGDD